ncbi:hypothetical protein FQA47_004246, partial [Oryzias melastigma]
MRVGRTKHRQEADEEEEEDVEEEKEEEVEKEEGGSGGEGRLRREQSAGVLWITWSSTRLRIYSSTAAVSGSHGGDVLPVPRAGVRLYDMQPIEKMELM